MANYNRIKSAKAVPIGTIMPWTGSSSTSSVAEDAIPFGYIICRGQTLRALDYPLLAQLLGNTYGPYQETGGPAVGIQNSYPNYEEEDVFMLPSLNNCSMVDLESSRLDPVDNAVVGTYITENGNDAAPLNLITSYIDVNFSVDGSTTLAGKITGITLSDPAFFDTYRTIPRKLGIDHTPAHTHPRPTNSDGTNGSYPSAQTQGTYVSTFMPGQYDTQGSEWTTTTPEPLGNEGTVDNFTADEVSLTWYDPLADSLVDCSTFRDFTSASQTIPQARSASSPRTIQQYYSITADYDDDYSCIPQVDQPAVSAPFPPEGRYNGFKNAYVGGGSVTSARRTGPYPTTLSHNADQWGSQSLASHNHFTIDLSMTKGQMRIPTTTLINNMTTGTIAPVSVDKALSVQINPNTPSLTTLVIMRAF
nr:putative short tail fibre [uncultured Mediterranean phage uvMED]|tara:strand:- start:5039 stop:6295 length:1257 start_codon:yes stop_codon:yes gene_type:complete